MIYGMSPYGGLIRYWTELLTGLTRHGVAVELIVPVRSKAPIPALQSDRSALPRPDRWIFHSSYLSAAPSARSCATVMTVHDLIFEECPQLVSELDATADALELKKRCISRADRIIVPSACTLRRLHDHHPSACERARVIHHGVEKLFFDPVHPTAADAARRLRRDHRSQRQYLLHVGGRTHHKNFKLVLDAYVHSSLHERFDLLVVGSQPHALPTEEIILKHAPRSAVVAFTGGVSLEVLAALYRGASVLVAPSYQEGFGLAPVEAMASGTAVACAATDIFAETLGDAAFTFDPTDPAACCHAIELAATCSTDRRELARQTIRERFDWDRTIRETIEVYGTAAGA